MLLVDVAADRKVRATGTRTGAVDAQQRTPVGIAHDPEMKQIKMGASLDGGPRVPEAP